MRKRKGFWGKFSGNGGRSYSQHRRLLVESLEPKVLLTGTPEWFAPIPDQQVECGKRFLGFNLKECVSGDGELDYRVVDITNRALVPNVLVGDPWPLPEQMVVMLGYRQLGESDVTVRVTDSQGNFADDTFHIEVYAPEPADPGNRGLPGGPNIPEDTETSAGLSVEDEGTLTINSVDAIPAGAALNIGSDSTVVLAADLDEYSSGPAEMSGGTVRIINEGLAADLVLDTATAEFWCDEESTFGYDVTGSTGDVVKTGPALLTLSGNNNYQGGTTIEEGLLEFADSGAVPPTGEILVNLNGALVADGAFSSVQDCLDSGVVARSSEGTLGLMSGTTGDINLADSGSNDYAYANLSIGAAEDVTYGGTITPCEPVFYLGGGPGVLTLTKGLADLDTSHHRSASLKGNVILQPGTGENNTYSDGTIIEAGASVEFANSASVPGTGTIFISGPDATHGLPAGVLEADGAYLTAGGNTGWLASGKIATTSPGVLGLKSNETGDITLTGRDYLYIGAAGGDRTYSTGQWTPGNYGFKLGGGDSTLIVDKALSGTGVPLSSRGDVELAEANTYTGTTSVLVGTLSVTGSLSSSTTVTVSAGASFSPGGDSADSVAIGSLELDEDSRYAVQVNGDEPGDDYDQLQTSGDVTLAGTLDISGTRAQKDGVVIVLIVNGGSNSVTGTFAGLDEGAAVVVNDVQYTITYHYNAEAETYGNGNDVALIDARPLPDYVAPGGLTSGDLSAASVRYANGDVILPVTFSEGISGIGLTPVYSNQLSDTRDLGMGYNWMLLPYLTHSGTEAVVTLGPGNAYFFGMSGTSFTPHYGTLATLAYDSTNSVYRFTQPDGTFWEFERLSLTGPQHGQFLSVTSPGGAKTWAVDWDTEGRVKELWSNAAAGASPYQHVLYEYFTSGDDAGRLQYVTVEGNSSSSTPSWTPLRLLTCTYYGDSDDNGSPGDLKFLKNQVYVGSNPTADAIWYFRYYKDGDAKGFAHGLKLAVSPQGYANADNDFDDPTDPNEVGDVALGQYAARYFEYNSARQVSTAIVDGLYQYGYSYTTNTPQTGYNAWQHKTVEGRPDRSSVTLFTNLLGQPILEDFRELGPVLSETENHWYRYWEYGTDTYDAARLVRAAEPSAVSGYTAGTALDVDLNSGAGLLHQYVYAESTTADEDDPGDVTGYLVSESVLKGEDDAAPDTLASYEYYEHTVGSEVTERIVHPLASSTVYTAVDGGGAAETTYAYTWASGAALPATMTTMLPIVDESHNGPDEQWTRAESFDAAGNVVWEQDELGRLTYHAYHPVTGALAQTIEDYAGTSVPAGCLVNPPGAFPGSGVNATTDYTPDIMGRTTEILGPEHTIDNGATVRTATWLSYLDASREIRSASGYATMDEYHEVTDWTLVNPISLVRFNLDGQTTEEIEAPYGTEVNVSDMKLADLDGTSLTSSYSRVTIHDYAALAADNYAFGQEESARVYTKIYTNTFSTSIFGYDAMGRPNRVRDPSDNITVTEYDASGLVTSEWIGTNDGASSNMVCTAEYEYDGGEDGGDGNLTAMRQPVDDDPDHDRVTTYGHDWRGRTLWAMVNDGTYQTYTYSSLDNLGRVTQTRRFHDTDESGLAAVDAEPTGDVLLAKSTIAYDVLGQVYQSEVYPVASNGTPGDPLVSNLWHDAAGNLIKSQSGGTEEFAKWEYDGLNRATVEYVGYDPAGESIGVTGSYSEAADIGDDVFLQQTETTWDAANNVIFATICERFHDDDTTTGALSPSTSRASYVGYWQDGIGRQTATVNYGTRSAARPDAPPLWNNNDGDLVTRAEFNARGEVEWTYDAENRKTKTEYDDAGRAVKTIENYVDGNPDTGISGQDRPDQDIVTEFGYHSAHLLRTMTVTATQADGSGTDVQETKYVYGTDTTDASPAAYRHDLLAAVIYADSNNTFNPLTSEFGTEDFDRVEYKYNRQGDVIQIVDQATTTHQFDFDGLGRQTADRVTNSGSGINTDVLRIDQSYNVRGQVSAVTSYSDPDGGAGNIVNQVVREYNDFGQLAKEYQEHAGVKDSSTLYVGYGYSAVSTGSRLESVRYPNKRKIFLSYAGGTEDPHDAAINRLFAIQDDDGTGQPGDELAKYRYLGLNAIVTEDYIQPQVKLNYAGTSSGSYPGLDRFGRVVDQVWESYSGTPTAIDEYGYGYDRLSNRIWKQTLTPGASGKDELYGYDHTNRLTSLTRGTLTGLPSNPSIVDATFAQGWGLDGLGNWSTFDQNNDGQGANDLEQTRKANAANEIDDDNDHTDNPDSPDNGSIAATLGADWVNPIYDAVGNMARMPKPGSETTALTCTYDAWNRTVSASDGTTTVNYAFDGLGRRIERIVGSTVEHSYYSGSQVVETREGSTVAEPESLDPQYQFVWSARYVDAPILRDVYDDGELVSDDRIYFTTDANFNVTAITNTSGAVLERYVYDAYGAATIYSANWTTQYSSSQHDNDLLFTGKDFDAVTHLGYYIGRWYNVATASMLTRDPEGFAAGDANLYRYCQSNPLNLTDPSGMNPVNPPGGKTWDTMLADEGTLSFAPFERDGIPGKWVLKTVEIEQSDHRYCHGLGVTKRKEWVLVPHDDEARAWDRNQLAAVRVEQPYPKLLREIREVMDKTSVFELWPDNCQRWLNAFEDNLFDSGIRSPLIKEKGMGWEPSMAIGGGHAYYYFKLQDGTVIKVDHYIYYGGSRLQVFPPEK